MSAPPRNGGGGPLNGDRSPVMALRHNVAAKRKELETMPETWKPIPKWEGYYEVSDQGRVRSLDRVIDDVLGRPNPRPGRILRTYPDSSGYPTVRLKDRGRFKRSRVHSIVLSAFVSPRPPGYHGCHNDGDKGNNKLSNLRWDTPASNEQDKLLHGTNHEVNKTHCPRGHILAGENLAPWALKRGGRTCLACARAVSYCKKYNLMDRYQEYADAYFSGHSGRLAS